jgi:hypothetical protein
MESKFDWEKVNLPEIVDALSAMVFAPMIVPVAEVFKQPIVQTAIKESMTLSQRYQDAMTEAFESVSAAVNRDSTLPTSNQFNSSNTQISQDYLIDAESDIGKDLLNIMSDFNDDVYKMTNGTADLRVILPLGLGFFAITQLIKQGFKFDDIPWYILAWFAFDSFIKLNAKDKSPSINIDKN